MLLYWLLASQEALGGLLMKLPLISRQLNRIRWLELTGSMAAYLASGEDIVKAADLSAKAVGQAALRRKLENFAGEVRQGRPWIEAWEAMKMGTSLDQWIIRNAAAREDPAEGFDSLLKWLYLDIQSAAGRGTRWVEIAGILLNAAIVTFIGMIVMGTLVGIMNHMAIYY